MHIATAFVKLVFTASSLIAAAVLDDSRLSRRATTTDTGNGVCSVALNPCVYPIDIFICQLDQSQCETKCVALLNCVNTCATTYEACGDTEDCNSAFNGCSQNCDFFRVVAEIFAGAECRGVCSASYEQCSSSATNLSLCQTDSEHVGLHARVPNMTLNLEDKMRGTRQERIEITRTINRTQGKSSDSEPCPFFVKHGQSGISSTTRDYHLLETKVA